MNDEILPKKQCIFSCFIDIFQENSGFLLQKKADPVRFPGEFFPYLEEDSCQGYRGKHTDYVCAKQNAYADHIGVDYKFFNDIDFLNSLWKKYNLKRTGFEDVYHYAFLLIDYLFNELGYDQIAYLDIDIVPFIFKKDSYQSVFTDSYKLQVTYNKPRSSKYDLLNQYYEISSYEKHSKYKQISDRVQCNTGVVSFDKTFWNETKFLTRYIQCQQHGFKADDEVLFSAVIAQLAEHDALPETLDWSSNIIVRNNSELNHAIFDKLNYNWSPISFIHFTTSVGKDFLYSIADNTDNTMETRIDRVIDFYKKIC